MQRTLNRRKYAVSQRLQRIGIRGLGQSQGYRAGEALQVKVVLVQVVAELLQGQGGIGDFLQEGVSEDLFPYWFRLKP
jgi:hypothetical protein